VPKSSQSTSALGSSPAKKVEFGSAKTENFDVENELQGLRFADGIDTKLMPSLTKTRSEAMRDIMNSREIQKGDKTKYLNEWKR